MRVIEPRTAALLEPPPAIVRSVQAVVERAAFTFAKEEAARSVRKPDELAYEIKNAGYNTQILAEVIREMEPSDVRRFDLPQIHDDYDELHIWRRPAHASNPNKYHVYRQTQKMGAGEPILDPPIVIDQALDADEAVAAATKILNDRVALAEKHHRAYDNPKIRANNAKEMKQIEEALEGHHYEEHYDGEFIQSSVPVDFKGSRYESEIDVGELPTRIRVRVFPFQTGDAKGTWAHWSDTIEIFLASKPASYAEAQRYAANAAKTVEHEVAHVAQYYIQQAKGLKAPAGVPSMNKPLDTTREHLTKEHEERAIEFYPNLITELGLFEEWRKGQILHTESELLAAARKYIASSYRFNAVKKRNPARWEKMVTEFLRAAVHLPSPREREPGRFQRLQTLKEERALNFAKVPDAVVAKFLELGWKYQRDREHASWQDWVRSNRTAELALVLANEEPIYRLLMKLPLDSEGEYPDLEGLIERFRTNAGLPYEPQPDPYENETFEEYRSRTATKARLQFPWDEFDPEYDDEPTNRQVTRIVDLPAVSVAALLTYRGMRKEEELFARSPSGRYIPEKWAAFVADIKKNGVKTPVVLGIERGRAPVIVEGNHRLRGAQAAGVRLVPVDLRYFGGAELDGLHSLDDGGPVPSRIARLVGEYAQGTERHEHALNVQKIYELEYKLAMLARAPTPLPQRAYQLQPQWERTLGALLDVELDYLASVTDYWLETHSPPATYDEIHTMLTEHGMIYARDNQMAARRLRVVVDLREEIAYALKDLLEKWIVANPPEDEDEDDDAYQIAQDAVDGIERAIKSRNWRAIWSPAGFYGTDISTELPDSTLLDQAIWSVLFGTSAGAADFEAVERRVEQLREQTDRLPANARVLELKPLLAARPTDLAGKVVLFHRALTTAHNNGPLATRAYGRGAVEELSRLSAAPELAWDAELKTLLSAPRGAMRQAAERFYWRAHAGSQPFAPGDAVPVGGGMIGVTDRHSAVEALFEKVRAVEFPERPSRLSSIFLCSELTGFCDPNRPGGPIYEVEPTGATFETNAEAFDGAWAWLDSEDRTTTERRARRYWEGEPGQTNEVLAAGARIVQPLGAVHQAARVAFTFGEILAAFDDAADAAPSFSPLRVVGGRLEDVKARYPGAEDVVARLSAADPSKSNAFLSWMAARVVGEQRPEAEVVDLVGRFMQQRQRLPVEARNLDALDFATAEYVVDQAERTKTRSEQRKDVVAGAPVIATGPNYKIYEVKNKAASCALGAGTRWCITSEGEDHFENYVAQGARFFFVIQNDGTKYAIATTQSGDGIEIFDAEDRHASPTALPVGALDQVLSFVGHTRERAQEIESKTPVENEATTRDGRVYIHQWLTQAISNPYVDNALIDTQIARVDYLLTRKLLFQLAARPQLTETMKKALLTTDSVARRVLHRPEFSQEEVLQYASTSPIAAFDSAFRNPNIDQAALATALVSKMRREDLLLAMIEQPHLKDEGWRFIVNEDNRAALLEPIVFREFAARKNRPSWVTEAVFSALDPKGPNALEYIHGVDIPPDFVRAAIAEREPEARTVGAETVTADEAVAITEQAKERLAPFKFRDVFLRVLRRHDLTKAHVDRLLMLDDLKSLHSEDLQESIGSPAALDAAIDVYGDDASILRNPNLTAAQVKRLWDEASNFETYLVLLQLQRDKLPAKSITKFLNHGDHAQQVLGVVPDALPRSFVQRLTKGDTFPTRQRARYVLWRRDERGDEPPEIAEVRIGAAHTPLDFERGAWDFYRESDVDVDVAFTDGSAMSPSLRWEVEKDNVRLELKNTRVWDYDGSWDRYDDALIEKIGKAALKVVEPLVEKEQARYDEWRSSKEPTKESVKERTPEEKLQDAYAIADHFGIPRDEFARRIVGTRMVEYEDGGELQDLIEEHATLLFHVDDLNVEDERVLGDAVAVRVLRWRRVPDEMIGDRYFYTLELSSDAPPERQAMRIIGGRKTLDRLLKANPDDHEILAQLAAADPTPNHDWLEGMYRWWRAGSTKHSDTLGMIRGTVDMLHRYQLALRDKKRGYNPQDFKTVDDAFDAVQVAKEEGAKPRLRRQDAKYEKIYDVEGLQVFRVDNKEASCVLGSDSDWCSSKWNEAHYEERLQLGKPYIARFADGRAYMVRIRDSVVTAAVDREDNDVLNSDDTGYQQVLRTLQELRLVGAVATTKLQQIRTVLEKHGPWAYEANLYFTGGLDERAYVWTTMSATPEFVDSWLRAGVSDPGLIQGLVGFRITPEQVKALGVKPLPPNTSLSAIKQAIQGVRRSAIYRADAIAAGQELLIGAPGEYPGAVANRAASILGLGSYVAVESRVPFDLRTKTPGDWTSRYDDSVTSHPFEVQVVNGVLTMVPTRMAARRIVGRLIDLKGLDVKIAAALARAAHRALRKERSVTPRLAEEVVEAARRTLGMAAQAPIGQLATEPVLNVETADARFKALKLNLSSLSFGRTSGTFRPPRVVINVGVRLRQILEPLDGPPDLDALYLGFLVTVQHELRHAADWAYNETTEGRFDRTRSTPTQATPKALAAEEARASAINTPTEIASYAGNLAHNLWRAYGEKWRNLSGAELQTVGRHLDDHDVLAALRPENAPVFWRNVVSELEELTTRRTAAVETLPAILLEGWEYVDSSWSRAGWNPDSPPQTPEARAWAQNQSAKFAEPIEVHVANNGSVLFNDGHHRAMAGKILGVEVPIVVKSNRVPPHLWSAYLDRVRRGFRPREINPERWKLTTVGVPSVAALEAGRKTGLRDHELLAFYRRFEGVGEDEPLRTAQMALPPRQIKEYLFKILPGKIAVFDQTRAAAATAATAIPDDAVPRGLRNFGFAFSRDPFKELRGFEERTPLTHMAQMAEYALDKYSDLSMAEHSAREYQERLDDLRKEVKDYNEYEARLGRPTVDPRHAEAIARWVELVLAARSFIADFVKKMKEATTYREDDRRPAHEPVEVLYHATVNAHDLARDGFQMNVPEKGGIGGSQSTKDYDIKGISFTADLYVALQIARCLKEVIGIANGEYKYHDVLRWATQDGLNAAELEKSARNTFMMGRDIPQEHRKIEQWRGTAEPHKNEPRNVFGLYRAYLAFSRRYDPLFFNVSIEQFRGLDPAQVGVVKATVDMTDPVISYAPAMHEWRVPPRAVKKIEGLIADRPNFRVGAEAAEPFWATLLVSEETVDFERRRTARRLVDAEEGAKVCVVIPIDSAIAQAFPKDDGEHEASDVDVAPHFTVLYIGDVRGVRHASATIRDVVDRASYKFSPIHVELSKGVSWFENKEGKSIAHKGVTEASAASLQTLHSWIRSELTALSIPLKHVDGFKAHATLRYCDGRRYDGPVPEGQFVATRLELWGYSDDPIFPLRGKGRVAQLPRYESYDPDDAAEEAASALELLRGKIDASGEGPPKLLVPPETLSPAERRAADAVLRWSTGGEWLLSALRAPASHDVEEGGYGAGGIHGDEGVVYRPRDPDQEKLIEEHKTLRAIAAAPQTEVTVYRGLRLSEEAAAELQTGRTFDLGPFASWSSSAPVAFRFAASDLRTGVVIELIAKTGKPVEHLSHFVTEREFLTGGQAKILETRWTKRRDEDSGTSVYVLVLTCEHIPPAYARRQLSLFAQLPEHAAEYYDPDDESDAIAAAVDALRGKIEIPPSSKYSSGFPKLLVPLATLTAEERLALDTLAHWTSGGYKLTPLRRPSQFEPWQSYSSSAVKFDDDNFVQTPPNQTREDFVRYQKALRAIAQAKSDPVIVYRGLRLSEAAAGELKSGVTFDTGPFGSWTTSLPRAVSFANIVRRSGITPVVLEMTARTGKDVRHASSYASEAEFLTGGRFFVQVTEHTTLGDTNSEIRSVYHVRGDHIPPERSAQLAMPWRLGQVAPTYEQHDPDETDEEAAQAVIDLEPDVDPPGKGPGQSGKDLDHRLRRRLDSLAPSERAAVNTIALWSNGLVSAVRAPIEQYGSPARPYFTPSVLLHPDDVPLNAKLADDEDRFRADTSLDAYVKAHKVMRALAAKPKNATVYRGLKLSRKAVEALRVGQEFEVGPFASWSFDENEAANFALTTIEARAAVVIELSAQTGAAVEHLSHYPEREFVTGGKALITYLYRETRQLRGQPFELWFLSCAHIPPPLQVRKMAQLPEYERLDPTEEDERAADEIDRLKPQMVLPDPEILSFTLPRPVHALSPAEKVALNSVALFTNGMTSAVRAPSTAPNYGSSPVWSVRLHKGDPAAQTTGDLEPKYEIQPTRADYEQAHRVLRALGRRPVKEVEEAAFVYRGLRLTAKAAARLQPGAEFDLGPFASWTESYRIAQEFASRGADSQQRVVLSMQPKTGGPIDHLSYWSEHEHVTGGKFLVTHVSMFDGHLRVNGEHIPPR